MSQPDAALPRCGFSVWEKVAGKRFFCVPGMGGSSGLAEEAMSGMRVFPPESPLSGLEKLGLSGSAPVETKGPRRIRRGP